MRTALPVLALATACAGPLLLGLGCDRVAARALSEEARLAIEVRCRQPSERAETECRRVLERVYRAGSLDPDKTLRSWCEGFKTGRWGGTFPPPPELCVERYGGWRAS